MSMEKSASCQDMFTWQFGCEEENDKKSDSKFSFYEVQAAFWRLKSLAKSAERYFPSAQGYSLVKIARALLLSLAL